MLSFDNWDHFQEGQLLENTAKRGGNESNLRPTQTFEHNKEIELGRRVFIKQMLMQVNHTS